MEADMSCNMRWSWMRSVGVAVVASACFPGLVATAVAQDDGVSIVADQVRSQGFQCDNPSSAERLEGQSEPNATVYLLKCEGITYRVVLVPDQAAVITQVQ
jgi:hypothetical protein